MAGSLRHTRFLRAALSLFLVVAATLVIYWHFEETGIRSLFQNAVINNMDASTEVRTANGSANYSEVEEYMFKKYGYLIDRIEWPFVKLKRQLNCSAVFEDWLAIANAHNASQEPPHEIPLDLVPQYTLNNLARHEKWYFSNNHYSAEPRNWTEQYIEQLVRNGSVPEESPYGPDGESVYSSTAFHSIANMTGLVVGSMTPWVEMMCLKNGAAKLITSEYMKIHSTHPQITCVHPIDMAKNWKRYYQSMDFVVSFSSIEHSGLGRYGDPLDPIADLREMQKIQCLLKRGGLLFIGLPVGVDAVVFNAHRIYGRLRLAMMFEGFQLLNAFLGNSPDPWEPTAELLNDMGVRYSRTPTFVLRRE